MSDAPNKIWLQRPNRNPDNEWFGEVTWCENKQNDDDTCYIKASAKTADLANQIESLQAEVEEQCRLNGMGAEREARLMARVDELERAARMALDAIEDMSYWIQPRKTDKPELCGFESKQGDKSFKKARAAITALHTALGEKK